MLARWKVLVLLGAATALAALAMACGGDEEEEAGANTVDVTLGEWVVDASPSSVSAGEVKFVVNNEGEDEHELVILKTDLAPDALPTKDDGSADEAAAGIEEIEEIEDIAPGESGELTVNLEAGKYVLICNLVHTEETGEVEAHYEEGMHAAFTVE